jgi:tape measure domain-containing protein
VSVVANVAINVDSSGAVSKLRQVQAQSKQTERAFGGIAAAATKLAVAFGGIQAARFVFAKTAELESQSRSLAILAGSAEKAGQIIKELQDLGAVTPFTSTELIDSAKRLQAFGVETDKVVETTRRLADASGATGAELSGLVTAYGQVQAKGRLQGEELLQFQERGIALQEELRKMYGMTGEEFQKALSKGQVSAKAVEVALANLTSTGGKYANGAIAQSDTLNGRLSTLQDGVDALARRIGQVLTPALKAIFNQAIAVVDAINAALAAGRGGGFTRNVAGAKQFLNIGATSQAVDNIAKGVGQVSSQKNKSGIQQNLQALQQYQRLLQSIGADDPNAGRAVQLQGKILTKINQNLAAQKQLQSGAKQVDKLFTPPLLGAAPAGGGGGGGAKKGSDDAKRAAEELANLQGQVTLKEKLFGIDKQIAVEKERGSLVTAAALEMDKALEERQTRIAEITRSTADTATKNAQIKDATLDADQKIYAVQQAIKEQEAERTKSFDAIIADLNLELALKTATTEQERERLRIEAARAKLQADLKGQGFQQPQIDQITGLQAQVAAPLTDVQKIDQHIGKLKDEIADLTSISNIAITAAEGIGNAFAQSFQGLISGSMTAKEALGSFFKSVADMFLDMAAQIIAKMIQMFILQQALKIFGGALGGGFGAGGAGFGGSNAFSSFDAGGAAAFGMPSLMAQGGFVTGPTSAVIGEGGESEYVIPSSKMDAAMSRYSRGARGEGVIAGSGGSDSGDTAAAAGPMAIDVRYSVERINDVEYVTSSQFQAGLRQAAQQGAAQGEQRTLRRLQQSPSTRKRVGV